MKKFLAALAAVMFLASCQQKVDDPKPDSSDFKIEITNLQAGYLYLNILPKDSQMTYYFNLMVKEDIENVSDEALLASDLEFFQSIAQEYSISLSELLSEQLARGERKWRFTGLMQSSDYVIYIYGISTYGEALTPVQRIDVHTPAVQKVDCDFEIVASNIQPTSFSVTISPSDDEVAYFYDIFPAEYYESLCGSQPEGILDYLPSYITELAAQNSIDVPYTVSLVSTFGTSVEDFTSANGLTPSSSYFVFAVGIGPDGSCTTDPVVKQVQTAAPPANTFTLLPGSIGHSSATYAVSPAHSESYVAIFERKCYLTDEKGELLPSETIISEILASQGDQIADHIYSGNNSISECPLVPDEDYCILVFGYFSGEVTTPLYCEEFHTAQVSPDTQQSFSIMSSEHTSTSFAVSFSPYYTSRPFIANYLPYETFLAYGGDLSDQAKTNAAIIRYNDEEVERLYQNWSLKDYADKKEFLHRRLYTDYVSNVIEGLSPDTEYLCYAVGMAADGTYTTDCFTLKTQTKKEYSTPQLSEVIPVLSGSWLTLWFYINTDTGATLQGVESRVNDSSFYDLSDEQIRDWFYEGYDWESGKQSPRRLWTANEYIQHSVGNVSSTDVVYATGILVGEDKDCYTVFRYKYPSE
ncbi:MAG: hypothetical protein ACI4TL_04320 [Candidatus Cryptobacteroides sp.]